MILSPPPLLAHLWFLVPPLYLKLALLLQKHGEELISGDQVLQDIYFQGWVGSGLGMEADTSSSGLAKRILFLVLNLYTVKASPQDQRAAV